MGDKYVFLDRDGVINEDGYGWTEYGYITRWEDFRFLPGVLEGIKKFSEAGYKCVIISNQQGVGKGYYTEEQLSEVNKKMVEAIREAGGDIAGSFYCTHTKEEDCDCRKPREGLFLKAKEKLEIKELGGKFYIGDTERDIQAGRTAGLKTILVLSGKTSKNDFKKWDNRPDHVCKDLNSAADLVIGGGI